MNNDLIKGHLQAIVANISKRMNADTTDAFTPSEDNFNSDINAIECINETREAIQELIKKF